MNIEKQIAELKRKKALLPKEIKTGKDVDAYKTWERQFDRFWKQLNRKNKL